MTDRRRTFHGRSARRRGFTLIESLMAAGILLIIVTAVSLAVSSGQQHGHMAQQLVAATLAADEFMCRMQAADYDDLDRDWDGREELPGAMVDINGNPLPANFAGIGRAVEVRSAFRLSPVGTAEVYGRTVIVRAYDTNGRTLVELHRFVPQPLLPAADDPEEDAGLLEILNLSVPLDLSF